MVNDIIDELEHQDMEPTPESLWWANTHQAEDKVTLKVRNRGLPSDLPSEEVFEVLGYCFPSRWGRAPEC